MVSNSCSMHKWMYGFICISFVQESAQSNPVFSSKRVLKFDFFFNRNGTGVKY